MNKQAKRLSIQNLPSGFQFLLTLAFVACLLAIYFFLPVIVVSVLDYLKGFKTFTDLMPNVFKTQKELIKCLKQTQQMVGYASLFSAGFGVLFGSVLVVTQKNGIMACSPIYHVLDKLINLFRSIPYNNLVALQNPATRKIIGTSIGVKGAIFPLVIATVPFFSRQIHAALTEVDGGMIEAARSMGLSPASIIFRVYLREGLPGMIRGATITIVNIIALTAMAGTVGGGGLGDYAIRYGYQRVMTDVTIVTIAIILLMVTIIQTIGTILERKLSH